VLSLRDLIVAKPSTCIATFMFAEPVAVKTDASEEEVTELVARYNLLAVPVVDAEGRLEGSSPSTTPWIPLCRKRPSAVSRASSAGPGRRSDEGSGPGVHASSRKQSPVRRHPRVLGPGLVSGFADNDAAASPPIRWPA